jgi:hypothetical protein
MMTALASAAIGLAGPALAAPLPLAQQTGPDLTTKIYASGDAGIPSVGPTVYGNTSPGAGSNVQFSGYSAYNPAGNGGVGSGTSTDIQMSSPSSNGFAQVADATFDQQNTGGKDDLIDLIMNPDDPFYMYEFSIQTLAGGQDINVFYWLTNGNMWILSTGSPLKNGNGDTQYIFGSASDPSVSVDKILIMSASPIEHVKQNSIQLTGTRPAVPEPATWGLMLLGFVGVGVAMRRSRKAKPALMQVA